MVKRIKARKIGGSVGVTVPKEMAGRLGVRTGDTLLAIETPDGILPTPYDPLTHEALDVATAAARRHRNALRQLAR